MNEELAKLLQDAESDLGPGAHDFLLRAYNLGRKDGLELLDRPFGHGWEEEHRKKFKGQAFEPEE